MKSKYGAITLKYHGANSYLAEEKIFLPDYSTSEDLKTRIRKTIADYKKMGWDCVNIWSRGAFIYLRFKQIT